MRANTYDMTVESGNVVGFVRILGKYGIRFDMGDEWNLVDNIDPTKKRWYRTFRLYTSKKQMKIICNEAYAIK